MAKIIDVKCKKEKNNKIVINSSIPSIQKNNQTKADM